MPVRYLAMWSGPRNISTAMMRAWGNRSDTAVIDEPFYGYYLRQTGLPHPGFDEIVASQPSGWRDTVDSITGAIPGGKSLYYQKHITTHMLPEIELDWLAKLSHCFLIRAPERVVASYSKTRPDANTDDLGYVQQHRLFDLITVQQGHPPPVLDTERFLAHPEDQLRQVCQQLDIEFEPGMLAWPAGIRETDGVWHPHWYAAVAQSTGFVDSRKPLPTLTEEQQSIAAECRPHYEALARHAIKSKV
ncbi:MAG: HAD family hydrolase [Gammaproteobacteria bacterium]|nr:HAD family hydrolase [Gammaproteobacteria bacterium]